ncbi:MAG: hypothetical protein H6748_19420 [Spirochaetaceae bacterium]|nr:hypothetical protein [Spirochaetaceae bacterium]
MKERIRALLARIAELEDELAEALEEGQEAVLYQITNRRVRFTREVREAHKRLRLGLRRWLRESRARNVASAPFIYGMIVPIALVDLAFTTYQAICFRLYRIPRVQREDYVVIDRHRLAYLNAIEKLNCAYCGYANGVIAYAREIAARTEQYWCPIKHARRALGTHARYAHFLEYGEPEDFHAAVGRLRGRLTGESEAQDR